MTDKELRKLGRTELLEMLLTQSKENEQLKAENELLKEKLESRKIIRASTGSMAEESLRLNGVFEAVQAAADQYLENIRNTEEACELIREEARKEAERILAEAEEESRKTEEACELIRSESEKEAERILAQAKEESHKYWDEVAEKLERFYQDHKKLKELLGAVGSNR